MKKYILSVLIFLLSITSLISQTGSGTGDTSYIGYVDNLDKMMNLWYIKYAETNKYLVRPPADRDTNFIPDFNDSIYLRRISDMNSVIGLSYNARVRSFINLYAKEKRKQLEVMLGLSEYYFPIFEQIFDEEGVPTELKYLSIIESALNPRARSKADAVGLWQFMYYTGKIYGLQADSYVDERQDPIKSTQAAARFLKDLHKTFDDWVLALAAYNCGPGNVRKAISRSGGKKNYWDIYNYLPKETRGYVPAFIAASYVMTYHEDHNLYPRNVDFPFPVDTVIVEEKVHLKQIAEVMGLPLQQLRDINPQFRIDIVPDNKPYALILPAGSTPKFIQLQDSIFNYKDSVFFDPTTIVKAPPVYKGYTPVTPKGKTKIVYTVKSGDNLGFIAKWYDVNIQDIKYWNGMNSSMVRLGQKLSIYKDASVASKYSKIDSYNFEQKNKSIGISSNTASSSSSGSKTTTKTTSTGQSSSDSKYIYHTVKSGDTLWGIARQYAGVTEQDIINLNNIKDSDKINAGMKLKVKKR